VRCWIVCVVLLAGCKSGEDGTGGGGGASTSITSTSSAGSTSTSASVTSSASTSSSTGTGGEPGCPAITVTRGTTAECAGTGNVGAPVEGTTECPADSSVYWPARLFRFPVQVGDCVFMRADNAGSPMGADLFGAVLDPGGKSLLFDEEHPCAVPNPEGYACPEGGTTIETTGDGYVLVGAWEGMGCTPKDAVPFQLAVSVNGQPVTPEPVCAGDLQVIIP